MNTPDDSNEGVEKLPAASLFYGRDEPLPPSPENVPTDIGYKALLRLLGREMHVKPEHMDEFVRRAEARDPEVLALMEAARKLTPQEAEETFRVWPKNQTERRAQNAGANAETGFSFTAGEAYYRGKALDVPVGFAPEVLEKLDESFGKTVPFLTLDPLTPRVQVLVHGNWVYRDPKTGSERLRTAAKDLRKAFRKARAPYDIKSVKGIGYKLLLL